MEARKFVKDSLRRQTAPPLTNFLASKNQLGRGKGGHSTVDLIHLPLVGPEEHVRLETGEVYLTNTGLLMEAAKNAKNIQQGV